MNHPVISSVFGFQLGNSYLSLPSAFYKHEPPTEVTEPKLVIFNTSLAESLGLNAQALQIDGANYFSGNQLFDVAIPFAQAYAGHQFGHFNMLGDGRAIMLGEHTLPNREVVDIQLKGAGRTPYSRSGDGRAALGPMLREYIMSEAMFALGIPTTRSLAVVTTGEKIYREDAMRGAILTRVAKSHIRVGTFQFAATLQDVSHLKSLADYTIARHFPDVMSEITQDENRYNALLNNVINLQATLVAKWMQVGFIHGVMNTDNVSICGETIDYGPCAFMNAYHNDTVFSSIDKAGRYAFGNQPNIAHWNLTRFAEALLPLLDGAGDKAIAIATQCLDRFPQEFFDCWMEGMRKKLGLFNTEDRDVRLVEDFLMYLQKHKADYTNTFVALTTGKFESEPMYDDAGVRDWYALWLARIQRQAESEAMRVDLMHRSNPKVIPRNHIIEVALEAAENTGDLSLVHDLLAVLANPYAPFEGDALYTRAPDAQFDAHYQTFCGT
jgi:serine/tyrosine/threonine adenylyltransferase